MASRDQSYDYPQFRFYLVLKGEIVIFADRSNRQLRLFAPSVPEHAYVAGPWLGQAHVPKHSKLELVNVGAGTKTPADCPDFLLVLPNPRPRPDLAYFEILVPLPHEILPGSVQDTKEMKVTIINPDGTTQPISHMPQNTCVAAILTYEWDGKHDPTLIDQNSGRTWSSGGKIPLYRSLHVCAAGETKMAEEDSQHAQNAFHEAAALLDVNAQIDFGGGGVIAPTIPPPGLSFLETNLSYYETLLLGTALGEILEGGPGKIPTQGPLHFLGGNCGPVGG